MSVNQLTQLERVKINFNEFICSEVIILLNLDGKINDYIFNVKIIMENMARVIKNPCFPNKKFVKSLDYNICEAVISGYYPLVIMGSSCCDYFSYYIKPAFNTL